MRVCVSISVVSAEVSIDPSRSEGPDCGCRSGPIASKAMLDSWFATDVRRGLG
jgi:hypothetical protein